jgi:putative RecB family exonuclease
MSPEDAQDAFREAYRDEVAKYTAITPNFEWWFKSRPYDGERDIERRHGIGLEQVKKMLRWYAGHPPNPAVRSAVGQSSRRSLAARS